MSSWTSNDWTRGPSPRDLDAAEIHLTVNVVIPTRNPGSRLHAVLAALALQTYPAELTTVTLVDDGSEPPVHATVDAAFDLRTARIEPESHKGLSAARAVGTAQKAADVIVFLDSDMLPEAQWLEAHMRWHATRPNAVVVGFRKHVKATTADPADVRRAPSVASLFDGEEVHRPDWIEKAWVEMQDGLVQTERLWRVASGGNVSVSSSLYQRAGGYDPNYWSEWGGEDNELAYRMYALGGLFIPERDAMAWHLGVGTSLGPDARKLVDRSNMRLASRVPSPILPRPKHLIQEVPEICIEMAAHDESIETILGSIDSILGALGSRIRIAVRLLTPHEDLTLMRLLLDHDQRVVIRSEGEPLPTQWQYSRVSGSTLPIDWSGIELDRLVSAVDDAGSIDVVGEHGPVARFWTTRLAHTRPDLELDEALGRYPRRLTSLMEWTRSRGELPTP